MQKLNVGIIGCGAIGKGLIEKIQDAFQQHLIIHSICDLKEQKAIDLKNSLNLSCEVLSLEEVIDLSDFVIEAAGPQVSFRIASSALKQNKIVLIMSVGGLLSEFAQLQSLIESSHGRLLIPSGAIAGLDGLAAAMEASVHSVTLRTSKPVKGLVGAPFFKEYPISLDQITGKTLLFKGNVHEAIRSFPKNINVAAILSLATLGPEKVAVEVYVDPACDRNVHQIFAEGDFGKIQIETENVPSPDNPRTSYLAVLSAFATLKKFFSPVRVGT